jgi:hypothetical protein
MQNTMTANRTVPGRLGAFAAGGRWLAVALMAGFALAAQAQTTATAVALVTDGAVTAITVMESGSGYTEPPVVTLWGGGGSGATAEALVTNGAVSQINVLTPGSGYTTPPEVVISLPPPCGTPPLLAVQLIPRITIHGLPGDTNQIETTTSLGAGAVWIPLATVVLTNSVQDWYDVISPPGSRAFYRAVLLGSGNCPTPGPRFVWLSAGHFAMGSQDSEVDRSADGLFHGAV